MCSAKLGAGEKAKKIWRTQKKKKKNWFEMSVSTKTRLRVNILIYLTTSVFHGIVFFTPLLSFELNLGSEWGVFQPSVWALQEKQTNMPMLT